MCMSPLAAIAPGTAAIKKLGIGVLSPAAAIASRMSRGKKDKVSSTTPAGQRAPAPAMGA